jgi:hypothetical protein
MLCITSCKFNLNFLQYLTIVDIILFCSGQNILDPATAELWVASRIFDRSLSVGDRLGKNEKTKVTQTILFDEDEESKAYVVASDPF